MNPKSSVPFNLLKLPGMSAIQAALQPRPASAVPPVSCKSSQDRTSLAQHQVNMALAGRQPNPAQQSAGWQRAAVPTSQPRANPSIGTRPAPAPVVASGFGNLENQQHNTGMNGPKGIRSAPALSTATRHSVLNSWKA
jgi:hypothetical protein